jgi:hypothetical protein
MSEEVLVTSCTLSDLFEELRREVKIRKALLAERRLLVRR